KGWYDSSHQRLSTVSVPHSFELSAPLKRGSARQPELKVRAQAIRLCTLAIGTDPTQGPRRVRVTWNYLVTAGFSPPLAIQDALKLIADCTAVSRYFSQGDQTLCMRGSKSSKSAPW
ncbi:MAG TPA: hypothetical protein VIT23_17845, partial [Terrimicrobiaceae bacterium]